jgi:hypothetical protein
MKIFSVQTRQERSSELDLSLYMFGEMNWILEEIARNAGSSLNMGNNVSLKC